MPGSMAERENSVRKARDSTHTTTRERDDAQFKQVPRLGFSLFKIPDSHYCRKWDNPYFLSITRIQRYFHLSIDYIDYL
jgi:hypothetical protein